MTLRGYDGTDWVPIPMAAADGYVVGQPEPPQDTTAIWDDDPTASPQARTTAVVHRRHKIMTQAVAAMQSNRDFVASTTPTQAQAVAQVKALSQQNNKIIRLLLGLLDATD